MFKYNSFCNIFLILIISCLLSGCGFKLRVGQSLPPQLQKLYYQAEDQYGTFAIAFKKHLEAAKIVVLPPPNNLNTLNTKVPVLHFASIWETPTTAVSEPSVSGRTYHLCYSAKISISDASGKILLAPQSVSATRDIILQSNELIEVSPQVDMVKIELQQELYGKIMNVLCAKNTFKILATDK
jgi:outer membrane lipopolysaccharide assembly protein LptE/RlpB